MTSDKFSTILSFRRKAVFLRIEGRDSVAEAVDRAVIKVMLESLPDAARVVADRETFANLLRFVARTDRGDVFRRSYAPFRNLVVENVERLAG